jgi:hypothetical protein
MPHMPISWRIRSEGWILVNDEKLSKVLENCKRVPVEVSGYTGDKLVPAWVPEAIKEYEKAGGYAGLSLFEWLDKMANEVAPPPKHTF